MGAKRMDEWAVALVIHNGKRSLSSNTVYIMTMNQIGDLSRGDDKFDLGFQIVSEKGSARTRAQIGAYGWGAAFATSCWVDPKRKAGIAA